MTSLRLAAKITVEIQESKVRHHVGFPPQLTGGKDLRVQMKAPAYLLIEQHTDGVFLYRYTADHQVAGDTWHKTVDDAKEQARFEYEHAISSWKLVPENVKDVIDFIQVQ